MSGPEVTITVRQVGLNPRRMRCWMSCGAWARGSRCAPPRRRPDPNRSGDVTVSGGGLQATEIGGAEIPNLIDEIQSSPRWRPERRARPIIATPPNCAVKESDRIATMVGNLQLLGVDARELADGLAVRGPARLKGAGNVRMFWRPPDRHGEWLSLARLPPSRFVVN
jgi:3-phosphoshikimate 1-carboxyvinyltransferase